MSENKDCWVEPSRLHRGIEWLLKPSRKGAFRAAVIGLDFTCVLSEHMSQQLDENSINRLSLIISKLIKDACFEEGGKLSDFGFEENDSNASSLSSDLLDVLQSIFRAEEINKRCKTSDSQYSVLIEEVVCVESGIAMSSSRPLVVGTDVNEPTETEGALSSGSNVSNDFMNSSFMYHQFDCRSDCTDSTGAEGVVNSLGSHISMTRRRVRSVDHTYSETSAGEGTCWDANSSLFSPHAALALDQQSYLLPTPPDTPGARTGAATRTGADAEQKGVEEWGDCGKDINQSSSSGAPTISNMLLSQSRVSSATATREECEGEGEGVNGTDEVVCSKIVSRAVPRAVLSGSGREQASSNSSSDRSGSSETSSASSTGSSLNSSAGSSTESAETVTASSVPSGPAATLHDRAMQHAQTVCSEQGDYQEDQNKEVKEGEVVLEVLVLPTMLPFAMRSMLHSALAVLGVQVRREHRYALSTIRPFCWCRIYALSCRVHLCTIYLYTVCAPISIGLRPLTWLSLVMYAR